MKDGANKTRIPTESRPLAPSATTDAWYMLLTFSRHSRERLRKMKVLVCLFAFFVECESRSPSSSRMQEPNVELRPASLQVRAKRRAYDGAPPVVPHESFGLACKTCHTAEGKIVPTIGIAPANPHDSRSASFTNCKQCHVFSLTDRLFVESDFQGIQQQHRPAGLTHQAPVISHSTAMRANCASCHTGPAARPEIVCSHPHRMNCVQCHVAKTTAEKRMPSAKP